MARAFLPPEPRAPIRIGRYHLFDEIGAGGMARVYLGRMASDVGISKVVAVKRMHGHFAGDVEFREMFLSEASLAARVNHPNVVSILDVTSSGRDILMVMEYVPGAALSRLIRAARGTPIPIPVAAAVLIDVLRGLDAAHRARDEMGAPLGIIHRDVSPHNVLVGVDGLSRIFDFGIAKALGQAHVTREGVLKGKLAYMAPERLDERAASIDRRTDIFSAGVVLWEMLAGERLYSGADDAETLARVILCRPTPLRPRRPDVPEALARVVDRALAREAAQRFSTAEEMARAVEAASPGVASRRAVAEWVQALAAEDLSAREARLSAMERAELFTEGPDGDVSHDTASFAAAGSLTTDQTRTLQMQRGSVRRRIGATAMAVAVGGALGALVALRAPAVVAPDRVDAAPAGCVATSQAPPPVTGEPAAPPSAAAAVEVATVAPPGLSAEPPPRREGSPPASSARSARGRAAPTSRPSAAAPAARAPSPADTGYMPEQP